MRVLFHLGHPAHFHLFKHSIQRLLDSNHKVDIITKEKDVLSQLLNASGFPYNNILPEGKKPGKIGLVTDLIKRGGKLLSWCVKKRPDLLIGTSVDISYIGKILRIPAVNVSEDDVAAIPLYAYIAYPWATSILSPSCCDNGKWQTKTITYSGYHELAYLHPDLFTADKQIVSKYCDITKPLFLLRLSGLNAHHDSGARGINDQVALELIGKIKSYGQIIISSERKLSSSLKPYAHTIDPVDMHHLLASSTILISDSQTMSAEAAVLGTPSIRYCDHTGLHGYLNELEEDYQLVHSFKIEEKDEMFNKLNDLLLLSDKDQIYQDRRQEMLRNKINVSDFLFEYIVEEKWKKVGNN